MQDNKLRYIESQRQKNERHIGSISRSTRPKDSTDRSVRQTGSQSQKRDTLTVKDGNIRHVGNAKQKCKTQWQYKTKM